MNNQIRKVFVVLFLVMLLLPVKVGADGTDTIKQYLIEVKPNPDGTLLISYEVNWCVISDAAGDLTWIEIGVPNRNFTIENYSGDFLKSVQPSDSKVRIDFSKAFRKGDCFTVRFQVRQLSMAHKNDKGEVAFQFIPGWFDEVPVEHLRVSWVLPQDESQIHLLEPQPTSRQGNLAVWEGSLEPGEKYKTINVLCDQNAFPQLPEEAAKSGSGGGNTSSGKTLLIVFLVIVAIVVIVLLVAFLSDGGGYGGGGYIGGSGGGYSGGGSFGGSSGRSSGGGGGFGGRGSSCVSSCVSSCACACACAGGGRAGCTRKGFDLSNILERLRKHEK